MTTLRTAVFDTEPYYRESLQPSIGVCNDAKFHLEHL